MDYCVRVCVFVFVGFKARQRRLTLILLTWRI